VADSSEYGIELSGCIIEEDVTVADRDYKHLFFKNSAAPYSLLMRYTS